MWLAVRIAASIALVVVPFGYAITGVHRFVLMGVGCGVAFGVGVGLRGSSRSGAGTGILVGSMVGIATVAIGGVSPLKGPGIIVPPVLALAVGLIDGLRGSSLSGYREAMRETTIVSVLLALGFVPSLVATDPKIPGFAVAPLMCMPWIVLVAGLLSRHREEWLDARPPRALILSAVALFVLLFLLLADEKMGQGRFTWDIVSVLRNIGDLSLMLIASPAAAFLLGRAAITWLQPRLRVYGHLTDHLRVMWVPIGGFAVGYLTIIVVFAGFYGMLERFRPGAFTEAGTGITDWLSFSFFTALAQDYSAIVPVSTSARVLVGFHLILTVGWALVLFAVMSSIQPRLEEIARRHEEEGDETVRARR